jgi:hypothetical protein
MTRRRFDATAMLRVALAAVIVVDLFSFFLFVRDARPIGVANGTLNAFNDLMSRTPVCGAVVVLGIAAAIAFARRPGRLWEGVVALAALALLSTVHAQLFGSPWRHLYYSGLCLSGWLLGLAVARRQGAPADESYARMGSLALLSAAYLNAGISKIVFSGSDWLSGLPIQEVVVGQDGLVADSPISAYRFWVVNDPTVAAAFSVVTVGFELAAPLMLAGRRTRAVVALGLFGMHANIYVLTDILYWEAIAFLLLFGLSPDPPPAPAAADGFDVGNRAFAASSVLLILGALVAISHQGRRFAASQAAHAGAGTGAASIASPPALSRQRVGPFAVGQTLTDGWTIDSVAVRGDGILTALSGAPGRAVFETTCAVSEHSGPFDIGATHIFYSSELEFADVEPVGRALRAAVQAAAHGQDVCATVADWRTAAQAGEPR